MISSVELVERTEATYRQIDYWCRIGVIETTKKPTPGSGYKREFDESIVPKVKFLVTMSKAFSQKLGSTLQQLSEAYDKGSLELDGITISWRTNE